MQDTVDQAPAPPRTLAQIIKDARRAVGNATGRNSAMITRRASRAATRGPVFGQPGYGNALGVHCGRAGLTDRHRPGPQARMARGMSATVGTVEQAGGSGRRLGGCTLARESFASTLAGRTRSAAASGAGTDRRLIWPPGRAAPTACCQPRPYARDPVGYVA
jgi:hypothetical protein